MNENLETRKYKKRTAPKKLGIRHYINTKLKGVVNKLNEKTYPLYIQITFSGQTIKVKSELDIFLKEDNLNLLNKEQEQSIFWEKEKIQYYFSKHLTSDFEKLTLSEILFYYYEHYSVHLDQLVEERLRRFVLNVIDYFEKSNIEIVSDDTIYSVFTDLLRQTKDMEVLKSNKYYKSKAISILEFNIEFNPKLVLLKKFLSSKIWFFDVFYNELILHYMDDDLERPVSYTYYDFEMDIFQQHFLTAHDNCDYAEAIVADMETIFKDL